MSERRYSDPFYIYFLVRSFLQLWIMLLRMFTVYIIYYWYCCFLYFKYIFKKVFVSRSDKEVVQLRKNILMTGKVSKAFVLLELLIFIIFTTPPFSFILLVTIFHQIYYDSQRYLAHFITLGLLSLIYRMKCINTSLKCWHWASFPAPVSLLHEYN